MTNTTPNTTKDTVKSIVDRVRDFYRQGSTRTVVFRKQDGAKLFEINLSLAVIAGVLAFLFAGWLLLLSVVVGYLMKVRVDVIGEVQDRTTIEINEE